MSNITTTQKKENKMNTNTTTVPEEFAKVVKNFVRDIKLSFPEFRHLVNKWWKDESNFEYITDEADRKVAMERSENTSLKIVYDFVKKKYPPRFMDIVYQNDAIFADTSEVDTEFLPYIHFRSLWQFELTEKMRQTIWKYLQLILFSIVHTIHDDSAFGESLKIFETMDENNFKNKLQEVLVEIQKIFNISASASASVEGGESTESNTELKESQEPMEKEDTQTKTKDETKDKDAPNTSFNIHDLPNVEGLHHHLSGLFDGKMGKLAKEIAAETAEELNLDMENVTDVKDLFQKMFSNPGKLMGMFKNIGEKLETKMSSGDIKETELVSEVTDMMSKMKGMPGMNMFQDILSKMTQEATTTTTTNAANAAKPFQESAGKLTKPEKPKAVNAMNELKKKIATKKLMKEFQQTLYQQQQQQQQEQQQQQQQDPSKVLEDELNRFFEKNVLEK
jgi:hypothetical protein